jgi:MFS family permease
MTQANVLVAEPHEPSPAAFSVSNAYRYYVVAMLLVIASCNYADRYMLGVLFPLIKTDLGLSDTQMGFISGAAFTIAYALVALPIASLSDRFSRKKIITVAIVAWSLFTCLTSLVQNFYQLAIMRVLVGIGESGSAPPSNSIISDYFAREERTFPVSILATGGSFGIFIGYLAGGALAESIGWRMTLVAFGVPGMLIAALFFITTREPPRGHADGLTTTPAAPAMLSAITSLWKIKTYRLMTLSGTLYGMSSVSLIIWLPSFFVRSHGMDVAEVGSWLAFTSGVPSLLGMLTGGFIAQRLSKKNMRAPILMASLALALSAPLFVAVLTISSAKAALVLYLLPAFLSVLQGATLFATILAVSTVRTRAVGMAFSFFVINLGAGIVGPQLVGTTSDLLADWKGQESLRYALIGVTLVSKLGAAFLFFLSSRHIEKDIATSMAASQASNDPAA